MRDAPQTHAAGALALVAALSLAAPGFARTQRADELPPELDGRWRRALFQSPL